jgi:hypothetical protein
LRWVVLAGSGDGKYSAGFSGQDRYSVGIAEFDAVRVSVLQGRRVRVVRDRAAQSADEVESFEAGPIGRFLINGPTGNQGEKAMFKQMKKAVLSKSRAVKRGLASAVAVAAVAPVAAFAQTSSTSSTFDPSPIVDSINNVVPAVIAVGGAVIGVVAVAWGIKMVRTFLGR